MRADTKILVLKRWRQEDSQLCSKLEANLGYARTCLKNNNKSKTTHKVWVWLLVDNRLTYRNP